MKQEPLIPPEARVFGIGLSRTGTTSLTRALENIGVSTVHYPCDGRTHAELARADYRLSVLKRVRAITDISAVPFFPQFDACYPGSKFILTIREMDAWLESMRSHFSRLPIYLDAHPECRPFTEFICAAVYGSLVFHEDRMRYVYDTHVCQVQKYFKGREDDLLVLDLCGGERWDRLCGFLGCESPSQGFPHLNRG